MNRFHAHIYIEKQSLIETRALFHRAQLSGLFHFIEIIDKPIGPHPLGMIELHFSHQNYNTVIEWLKDHHGTFSTLIHQDTGEDYRDHTCGILWLGEPVEIDFSFFELIKMHPELSIH